jgi:hypothetical protein
MFERSRKETTYMSIRKGVSRRIMRETARFRAGSDVLRIAGARFKAGLIPSLWQIAERFAVLTVHQLLHGPEMQSQLPALRFEMPYAAICTRGGGVFG